MPVRMQHDNELGFSDLVTKTGILQTETGLGTAMLISLYTSSDAWWGDRYPSVRDDKVAQGVGSIQSDLRSTPARLAELEAQAKSALSWMLDDGIADEILASAEKIDTDKVRLTVTAVRPDDASETVSLLWEDTLNAV